MTRLTGGGVVLALVGLAALIGGLWAGYAELLAVGIVAGVVLLAAIVIPQVGSAIELERIDVPRMVSRGTTMEVGLRVTARRRSSGIRIVDQFAALRVPIELPSIEPRQPVYVGYGVRTVSRGVWPLGPILEERTDPFGVAVRSVEHSVVREVIVTPVVHRARIATSGQRERREALMLPRVSDDPMADFRTLRDYQPGDDPRAVHWPSSARTGTLMVKDYLQLRRARRAVLLETSDTGFSPEAFEEAVDIAATIAVDALEQSVELTLRTRDEANPGSRRSVRHRSEVLELLARVQRGPTSATLDPSAVLRFHGEAPDQLFLVMGAVSPLLGPLNADPLIRRSVIVVRVGAAARSARPQLPFPTIDVRSAREFVATVGR